LKSNQAIAYAAKIAIVIGIIVEGITIAKVFRKYWLRGGVAPLPSNRTRE
jgi:hypothetical protein